MSASTKRQILLISPREPSGATWLINCLLELGIKTYRYSPRGMWREAGNGRYVLNAHEHILKKWLPALSAMDNFRFRDDVEVRWAHEWPTEMDRDKQIIFFVRDPRDAIYSRYKREAPEQSFDEFVRFPDPYTLLNKADNWSLYVMSWLALPDVAPVKFEDYKLDATGTLRKVLAKIGITVTDADIDRAIQSSTQEKAAAAERKYRDENPQDVQLINRSGRHGEWMKLDDEREAISLIGKLTCTLRRHLGYGECHDAENTEFLRYSPNISYLSFFNNVSLPRGIHTRTNNPENAENEAFSEIMNFIRGLNQESLRCAKLAEHETLLLNQSIQEFLRMLGQQVNACFPPPAEHDISFTRKLRYRFLIVLNLLQNINRKHVG